MHMKKVSFSVEFTCFKMSLFENASVCDKNFVPEIAQESRISRNFIITYTLALMSVHHPVGNRSQMALVFCFFKMTSNSVA